MNKVISKNKRYKKDLRLCTKCLDYKKLSEFGKCNLSSDNLSYYCKDCKSNLDKIQRQKPDYKEKKKKYHYSKINQDYLKKYNSSPEYRFLMYKRKAKERGLKFKLSFREFMSFWSKSCFYCKSEINLIGLDRVDNNLGYTVENCVSCCEICNRMKLQLSLEFFINHCKKIVNNYSKELK